MKYLLSLFIILFPLMAHGAVSWTGNTCTITGDATVAQITDCLTGSSNGIVAQSKTGEVTIQLPADTQTWTSGMSINMSDATYVNVTSLIIKGAGTIPTGSTTGSAGYAISNATAYHIRIYTAEDSDTNYYKLRYNNAAGSGLKKGPDGSTWTNYAGDSSAEGFFELSECVTYTH